MIAHFKKNTEKAPVSLNTDWLSIIVLTIAAIMFVTAELLPVGILPEISNSFHEPIGKVGLIVTSYAWTVSLSAVFIMAWLAPLERRALLLLMMLLFALANFCVACSSSLGMLFIARILGAFSHGVFWASVGPLCMRLSGNSSKARATAFVFGGIAMATVIAVPAGTILSQWLGWRFAFLFISGISLLITIAIAWHFPKLPSQSNNYLKIFPKLIQNPLLKRLFPAAALALTGHFCAFTYISQLLEKRIGIAHNYLAFYLFLFGGAGIVGNVLAGMLADRHLSRACQWIITIMAIVIMFLALLPLGASIYAALLVIVWGAGICLLTVIFQSLILTVPSYLTEAASAIHVSMFNIGIGSGALLGGLFVDHVSPQAAAWVGSSVLLIAAIIVARSTKTRQALNKVDSVYGV